MAKFSDGDTLIFIGSTPKTNGRTEDTTKTATRSHVIFVTAVCGGIHSNGSGIVMNADRQWAGRRGSTISEPSLREAPVSPTAWRITLYANNTAGGTRSIQTTRGCSDICSAACVKHTGCSFFVSAINTQPVMKREKLNDDFFLFFFVFGGDGYL